MADRPEQHPDLVEAVRARNPLALARLRDLLAGRRDVRGNHGAWARLCEEVGEDGLALAEYQLAVRDDPGDAEALARLAVLYEERGDLEHAVECAERRLGACPDDAEALTALIEVLLAANANARAADVLEAGGARFPAGLLEALDRRVRSSATAEAPEDAPAPEPVGPTEADIVRFAALFAGRENVYARQWWSADGRGGYSPVHEPFTFQVARNHLLGNVTVGVYPVRLDGTVTFFALDLDITKAAMGAARASLTAARQLKDLVAAEGRRLLDALAGLGVPALLEDSGYKGRHLWVFLSAPEDAAVVHRFGNLFLGAEAPRSADLHAEFFPKQSGNTGGIGNLIKLPLGIHRRTGRWSRLLRPDDTPESDPHGALRSHPKLTREALYAAIAALKARPAARPVPAGPAGTRAAADGPGADADARAAGPEPPSPPQSWTSADFETNAEVAHILRRCPVLEALRGKAERHRRLAHDERLVLAHTLGHSGPGLLAVNYLLDLCVDTPPEARLQTPFSGNPMSCPKIRKRIPHVTGTVACNCRFDFAPDHYPTPRLHLRTLPPSAARTGAPSTSPAAIEDRARTLGVLRRQQREIAQQVADVERELIAHLDRLGLDRLELDEGVFRVHRAAGGPMLVWEARATEGRTGAAGETRETAPPDARTGTP